MEHERKKVLVGMSGGIDSSAVCLMLLDEGYEVVGVTMRVWDLAGLLYYLRFRKKKNASAP